MLKQINKLLKLVGLNLVRAKRRKGVKWHGRLVVSTCEDPTPLLLALTEAADPKSFSVGTNPGKTHYVGDDCPGGHLSEFPGQENVCIGVGQDERPRHCEVADGAPAPTFDLGVKDYNIDRVGHPK